MSIVLLNQTLEAVEVQLAAVSAAMVAMDADMLEKSSLQLRQAAVQLTHALEGTRGQALPSGMSLRIQKVSEQLAMQRDNLARVAALVDRQVASVLPPADNASTYGKAAGTGNGPSAAARIYRSAG